MAHDPRRYPPDWKPVSVAVTWGRAQGRCEGDGCTAVNGHPHPITSGTVVLAACHICTCDPLCSDMDHLLALCQRCHLERDTQQHVRSMRATQRANMKQRTGQIDLLDDPNFWG